MAPNSTKAAHYGTLLDEARCEGDWDAIPELVRKIRKHSTNRVCLTYTAETECAIERATRNLPATGNAAAASSAKGLDAASQLPKLKAVMEEETNFPQDLFQAQVCVGWLYWVIGEYEQAFEHLPHSLEDELGQPAQSAAISDWTRVCGVKSAYLRANCLARAGKRRDALAVFQNSLPGLAATRSQQQSQKQLKYWSELFLTEYAMLYSHTLEQGETSLSDPNCLASFRAWSQYWEGTKGAALLGGSGFRGAVPRRRIWFEYYSVLSALVEDDLPYPTGNAQDMGGREGAQRDQLRIELKKTESVYEAILLSETTFPRADEDREEVEAFVQLVMQNWTIMKGRGWAEQDLGQGGKESMSRGVLDILYRASTKTYHSTAILRHLFTVHLAVAEFDLAFKAFDSYLGLIKKGKARVIKTEHEEPSLDDDATVLDTVSLCITALCRYGDRDAAEKAYGLSLQLEQALHELIRAIPENADDTHPALMSNFVAHPAANDIPLRVLAMSWQAVGTAHAQWARMTYDSAARSEIQAKAVRYLRKSLSADYGRSANLRGVFSLGLLLAEQRELSTAIELVKSALLSSKSSDADKDLVNGPYWRERSMIPLWHLLALLLSARQDYVMAARACEGAFEQFKDPSVLFGSEQLYRSEHLNEADAQTEKGPETSRGIVDEMDDYEKERIIDIKMTQLALVELMESPRVAVNASLELLSLFARLFGPAQSAKQALPAGTGVPRTSDNPRSSTGTLRNSIRGGLFSSKGEKSTRPATKQSSTVSRPQTTQTLTAAPSIQVTRDWEDVGRSPRTLLNSVNSERRSQSNKRHSLHKRERSNSRRRGVSSSSSHQPDNDQSSDFFSRRRRSSGGPPVSMSRQTSQTRSLDVNEMGVDGVEPTSSLMPLIQFSKEYEKRRRSTILVEIWLMIAGFYRRAKMYDDGKGALGEAQKLVQALEYDVSKDTSGDVSMRDPGWAGKKSVDELWGDVWSELGLLNLAKEAPYTARSDFEAALTHYPDHPVAIVGLSNILLDIYSEKLLPPPSTVKLELEDGTIFPERTNLINADKADQPTLPWEPLGLVSRPKPKEEKEQREREKERSIPSINLTNGKQQLLLEAGGSTARAGGVGGGNPNARDVLPPSYKATSLPLNDRLAARDRAFGLLTSLTRLGSTWNNSEAWFALARAHEESGQPEKAKEVLWWCVELEESAAVRPWGSVATGGYVL